LNTSFCGYSGKRVDCHPLLCVAHGAWLQCCVAVAVAIALWRMFSVACWNRLCVCVKAIIVFCDTSRFLLFTARAVMCVAEDCCTLVRTLCDAVSSSFASCPVHQKYQKSNSHQIWKFSTNLAKLHQLSGLQKVRFCIIGDGPVSALLHLMTLKAILVDIHGPHPPHTG
jgi:hypothetical protein